MDEGFAEVVPVQFKPEFESDYERELFQRFLVK